MKHVEYINPIPKPIAVDKVIVSKEEFSLIVCALNDQAKTINSLIDNLNELSEKYNNLVSKIDNDNLNFENKLTQTNTTIQALAKAFSNLQEG